MSPPTISAILLAGGIGTRFGSDLPKQFLELQGRPLIHYPLHTLQNSPWIQEVILVCDPQYTSLFSEESSVPLHFSPRGLRRQDSVYQGLQKARGDFICIHDGARPFLSQEVLQRVIAAALERGAAAAALPLTHTIKKVDEEGRVLKTLPRESLWEVQTPQVIKRELLEEGFHHAQNCETQVTDDVSLVEMLGAEVKLVEGSSELIKITHPKDLALAQLIFQQTARDWSLPSHEPASAL